MDHLPIQEFARRRHQLYLNRAAGLPRSEWTQDQMLQKYRFTNVYRELDRTTVWCKEHVRDPLKEYAYQLLAIVMFRWFNKIETGQVIFDQYKLNPEAQESTAWTDFILFGDYAALKAAILSGRGKGPYVTGSYIIKTPNGFNKLDGVLKCIEWFMTQQKPIHGLVAGPVELTSGRVSLMLMERGGNFSLQDMYNYLVEFPYLGSFMAAQLIADLKYTPLLCNAPDWHTFASSGPGSRRGLNIVCGNDPEKAWRPSDWHENLLELRERITPMFAQEGWEIPHAQDTQNICCEFSKYTRGFSRQVFK